MSKSLNIRYNGPKDSHSFKFTVFMYSNVNFNKALLLEVLEDFSHNVLG